MTPGPVTPSTSPAARTDTGWAPKVAIVEGAHRAPEHLRRYALLQVRHVEGVQDPDRQAGGSQQDGRAGEAATNERYQREGGALDHTET